MTTMTSVEVIPEMLFGENGEERLAVVFLLDSSQSMVNRPIRQVNEGIQYYTDFIKENPLARNRLDTTIISFGGDVTIHCQNAPADDLESATLTADGGTPMGEAILTALDIAAQQKDYYKSKKIDYIKPIIICLTDGQPTDSDVFAEATEDLLLAEAQDQVSFYCFGCNNADLSVMESMGTKHPPVSMKGIDIEKFFRKVSVVVSTFTEENGQQSMDDLIEECRR